MRGVRLRGNAQAILVKMIDGGTRVVTDALRTRAKMVPKLISTVVKISISSSSL